MKLRIALAQLTCADGLPERNIERVEEVAAACGPSHDLIVFPEGYITGFPPREETRSLAEPLDGPTVLRLKEIAIRESATFAVGLAEREGDRVYNTTVLIGPEGLLLSYRKAHLWVGESLRVDPGGFLTRRTWRDTSIGLLICYDIEFPEAARAVAAMGAELIVLTNGNMDPYGPAHSVAIRARAQENQVFLAMANRVGMQGSTRYCGESAVADPYGMIVAQAGQDEEILTAEIETGRVQESRTHYDYLRERRVGLSLEAGAEEGPVRRVSIGEMRPWA